MVPVLLALAATRDAGAFCGTYAGAAGASLTNQTSQMVVARRDGLTTLTLWSDLQGDLDDFALLIPVPPGTGEEDVGVTDPWLVEQIATWSAPRLSAYTCRNAVRVEHGNSNLVGCGLVLGCGGKAASGLTISTPGTGPDADGTVQVEATFTAGEYELAVLSAEDGEGLVAWLAERDFVLPDDPRGILQDYVDQGSWFLAARVRLDALPVDRTWLSPIQITYDTAGFVVPIRIGTLSSSGVQDVILYAIADSEVAIANYDPVEIERDCMPRLAGPGDLGAYHDEVLEALTEGRDRAAWTTEHSWSLFVKCDPCTPSDDTQMLAEVLPGLGSPG